MTPTEKLQRLIEIAKANGWKDRNTSKSIYYGYIKNKEAMFLAEYSEYCLFFDKSFIQALHEFDKKRKGKKSNRPVGMLMPNQILSALAISDNRIDYLWQIFGGAPEF